MTADNKLGQNEYVFPNLQIQGEKTEEINYLKVLGLNEFSTVGEVNAAIRAHKKSKSIYVKDAISWAKEELAELQ